MSAANLKEFAARLRNLPRVVAQKVATAAAPALTEAAKSASSAGQDPYGVAWAPLADGSRATLRRSGRLLSTLNYVAIGTKIRVALSTRYAKYVIGKRPVFPRAGGLLPSAYSQKLSEATAKVIREELGQ